jgi:hypothetical protein
MGGLKVVIACSIFASEGATIDQLHGGEVAPDWGYTWTPGRTSMPRRCLRNCVRQAQGDRIDA